MRGFGGAERRIDVSPSLFEYPSTPLTGSDISVPDVVPATPPLENGESDADASVRIQEDYGFPDVAEVIGVDESAAGIGFLKAPSPFRDSEGSAYYDIERSTSRDPMLTLRRKALLIGIKYDGVTAPVEGAHNDVEDMKDFLVNHYGWQRDEIYILKDDGQPTAQPTRDNIISEMQELVQDASAGDQLFFHFSGHGGQVIDTDGDEADGLDEVIFTCDKQQIVDDEIHDILVKPLPTGCRLTALFDCCSSGTSLDLPVMQSSSPAENLSALLIPSTLDGPEGDKILPPKPGGGSMLDLPHQYGHPSAMLESPPIPEGRPDGATAPERPELRRKYTAGNVIMWSSCQDSERSYEVVSRKDHQLKGAMTHAFIECLKDRKRQTYRELLDALSETLILWSCPQRPMMSSAHYVNMKDIVLL